MEKQNYLWMLSLLMLMVIALGSCSDNSEEEDSSTLSGLWEVVSYEGWEKYNNESIEKWDETDEFRVKFNNDGTYTSYEYDDGNWDVEQTGKWHYDNGKIYTYYSDGYKETADVAIVKELTSSRLVYEFHEKIDVYEYWERTTMRKID